VRTLPIFRGPAERIVALLRRLGYEAKLRVIADAYAFFHQISDSREEAQAAVVRWVADYPAASNFLELLSCDAFTPASVINNMNYAEFCDPAIDARMQAAARMQAINPQRANRLWAGVDRALVDAAPWVPLYNVRSVELVSRRVGNYRFSPIYGPLLDQLWVR
jgi:peptide/nickel transport system substrate-binding protein